MITDEEIQKIFDWADKNKLSGKRLSGTKYDWGIDIESEKFIKSGFSIIRNGIPRDKELIKQITHLNLAKKQLEYLPVEIFKLEKLTHLNLAKNHLDNLPKEVKNAINLEYLDISGNSIIQIPKEVGKLIKLKHFDLNWNWRYSDDEDEENPVFIPSEIGNLINLEYLDMSSLYGLENLPKEIGNLINLKSLDYSQHLSQKNMREKRKEGWNN